MKFLIVFIACLAAVCSQLEQESSDAAGRIINGNLAYQGQFPWQVGIFHYINGDPEIKFCGGSLISDEWVLTAGHCVFNAYNFQIILGTTKSFQNEPGKITVGAARALFHPQYNQNTLNNDVALIQLDQRVQFNNLIRPIRLAHSNTYLPGNYQVTVSGWGKTRDADPGITNNLGYVTLTTITNQQCLNFFRQELIQNYVLCANAPNFKSACHGDSGGPLVTLGSDGQPVHVGVVSFVSQNGCETGGPSGFSRTASFIDFINRNTGLNFQ